jgi:hypothetical protein
MFEIYANKFSIFMESERGKISGKWEKNEIKSKKLN